MNNSRFIRLLKKLVEYKLTLQLTRVYSWSFMVGNQRYFSTEYIKRRRPKRLIKIPAFSRTLFTSIIILAREMSFKVCQAHDTQQDFGALVKNAGQKKKERERGGVTTEPWPRCKRIFPRGVKLNRRPAKFASLRTRSGPLNERGPRPRARVAT